MEPRPKIFSSLNRSFVTLILCILYLPPLVLSLFYPWKAFLYYYPFFIPFNTFMSFNRSQGFGITLIYVGSTHVRTIAEFKYWLYYPAVSAPILAVFCGCGLLCLIALGFVSALKEYSTGLLVVSVQYLLCTTLGCFIFWGHILEHRWSSRSGFGSSLELPMNFSGFF